MIFVIVPVVIGLLIVGICYLLLRRIWSRQPLPTQDFAEKEWLQRERREEVAYQLRKSSDYDKLAHHVEQGNTDQALKMLHGHPGIEEGHAEEILHHLEQEMSAARLSVKADLYGNPNALRILLLSDNKPDAIELYHDQTGVSWQEAKAAVDRLEVELRKEHEPSKEKPF